MVKTPTRQEMEHILDPCYHHEGYPSSSSASGVSSMMSSLKSHATSFSSHSHSHLHAHHGSSSRPSQHKLCTCDTWSDATGNLHDPEFRPFGPAMPTMTRIHPSPGELDADDALPRRLSSLRKHRRVVVMSTAPCTPTRHSLSLDIPPTPPTKEARAAARSQLAPELRIALSRHERQLAKEQEVDRLPAWMRRHRRDRSSSEPSLVPIWTDDSPSGQSGLLVESPDMSPLPLPDLVSDEEEGDDSTSSARLDDEDSDDQPGNHEEHDSSHVEALRKHFVGLSLKVDLAVFRAKRRIKHRVGLA